MMKITSLDDWENSLCELGCAREMKTQLMEMLQEQNLEGVFLILRRYKRTLLEELHASEKRVDLLDFLLYELKLQKNGKEGF